jgi:hypothetical protein
MLKMSTSVLALLFLFGGSFSSCVIENREDLKYQLSQWVIAVSPCGDDMNQWYVNIMKELL